MTIVAQTQPETSTSALPDYLQPERTLVMGILNVTPNSFSDGGKWLDPSQAVAHGSEMVAQGADLIDVGGESTAPGRKPVAVEEEIARILPVIEQLVAAGVTVSVDTLHAKTAQAAAAAGASIINDVSGGIVDDSMFTTIAGLQLRYPQLSYICQHWRGSPEVANQLAVYDNVAVETWNELERRLELMRHSGIDMRRVIIDPGLGFSKVGEQDWDVLANLGVFLHRGYPVLVGPSRKRYLADLETVASDRHPRDDATAAVSMFCALHKVWAVRVHNVAPVAVAVQAAAFLDAHHHPC
ncbi:dihydropteroate synthase [Mobiluncus sp.]|uniref:dihydropteroate synthase n=1 Tax=Mobiluncus sp. TaxID=47293 RepID=UPI002A916824|nr:dihydropteroate synthase [Mobiluncus sp.]MDY6076384.1 dihydropteroate synthase [Mobiluncus sp.]